MLFWTVEIASVTQEQWTCWNGFTNRSELFICESNWSECSGSQVSNSLIHRSIQNDSKWAKHWNIRAWACMRLMQSFSFDYCKWKSFLGHDCQLFVDSICCNRGSCLIPLKFMWCLTLYILFIYYLLQHIYTNWVFLHFFIIFYTLYAHLHDP